MLSANRFSDPNRERFSADGKGYIDHTEPGNKRESLSVELDIIEDEMHKTHAEIFRLQHHLRSDLSAAERIASKTQLLSSEVRLRELTDNYRAIRTMVDSLGQVY